VRVCVGACACVCRCVCVCVRGGGEGGSAVVTRSSQSKGSLACTGFYHIASPLLLRALYALAPACWRMILPLGHHHGGNTPHQYRGLFFAVSYSREAGSSVCLKLPRLSSEQCCDVIITIFHPTLLLQQRRGSGMPVLC
jgi:hypothetical protein